MTVRMRPALFAPRFLPSSSASLRPSLSMSPRHRLRGLRYAIDPSRVGASPRACLSRCGGCAQNLRLEPTSDSRPSLGIEPISWLYGASDRLPSLPDPSEETICGFHAKRVRGSRRRHWSLPLPDSIAFSLTPSAHSHRSNGTSLLSARSGRYITKLSGC
jgi:hypothetical protein